MFLLDRKWTGRSQPEEIFGNAWRCLADGDCRSGGWGDAGIEWVGPGVLPTPAWEALPTPTPERRCHPAPMSAVLRPSPRKAAAVQVDRARMVDGFTTS